MQYLELILKGLVSGLLSAYLLIYGLRPAIPYPDIILEFFEHKILFLLLLLVNYYVFVWDYNNGSLFLLCVIALTFDYVVFTGNDEPKETNSNVLKEDKQNTQETFFIGKSTGQILDKKKIVTFDEMLIKMIKEKVSQFMGANDPAPFIA